MPGLTGMKAICNYLNRSESTVLGLIRFYSLPACKIGGGIWESDTELIDSWRKEQISNGMSSVKSNNQVDKNNKCQKKTRNSKSLKKS